MTWHLSHRNPPLERGRRSRDGSGSKKKKRRRNEGRDCGKWAESNRERKVELEYNISLCLCASYLKQERAWEGVTKGKRRCKVGELQAVKAGGIDWLMKALKPYTLHQTHKQMLMPASWSPSFSLPHTYIHIPYIHSFFSYSSDSLLRADSAS